MSRPASAGPTMRAVLNVAELMATALGRSSRPTISTTNAWRVGMSTALLKPSRRASTEDLPDLDPAAGGEREEAEGQQHLDDLRDDERAALGQRVRDEAAEEAEDEHGQELRGRRQPQDERVAGELEDQPGLRHRLHPRPHQGDHLTAEEQPVVAVAEDARRVGERRPRAVDGRVSCRDRASSA